jgi:tetratricopeptide (TPR) repeat protein
MAKEGQNPPRSGRPPLRARLLRWIHSAMALGGWLRAHPRLGSFLVGGVLLAMIGLATGLTLTFWPTSTPASMRRLAQAFARFDAGDHREARQLAAELLVDPDVAFNDRGGPYLILGAITLREADEQVNPAKRQLLYLVAARYLDEGRTYGFPSTREPHALWMLGRALHHAGRYSQSVAVLREALTTNLDSAPSIHALLADSYLRHKPPRLAEALEQNRKYLASANLSPRDQDAGRLIESRILLAQGHYAAATEAAEQIRSTSSLFPEAAVLQARIALEDLRSAPPAGEDERRARCQAVIDRLRPLVQEVRLAPETAGRAQLLIGLAYDLAADRRAATAQFERVRRLYFGREESLAATVFLADLVRLNNPAEAVSLYKRAIGQAGPADAYENDWLPGDALQMRLETAVESLADKGEYAAAIELAEALVGQFPRGVALQRQASIHRAWARRLQERAERERQPQAGVTEAEARYHWRRAGILARELADLRVATRYYLEDLARAADDFRRGQGYEQAVAVYRELLKQDPRQGKPEALVGLGEALLAIGKSDEAVAELDRCRELYPKHPSTYQARLIASLAFEEQGKLAEAKELLIDNLYRFSLAPQSTEWRDSLFALGALLYRQGLELETRSRLTGVDRQDADVRRAGLQLLEQSHATLQEAIRTLGEAVQRYPSAPQALEARYRIADAHRHSAKLPRKRLATISIETSRISLVRQMQEHLQEAVDDYTALIARLSDQQGQQRWPTEAAILRNCYFSRADALFDLGRYEDAIQAYSAATNRYQHDPESLEAYVQIASCYRRMDRPIEARGTLEQARVVLQRIRPDAQFTQTTRLDREQWAQLLNWLRTL